MALPQSGPISLGQVRTELKLTGPISLGQAQVRQLAGKQSGTIKMSDLYGKSAENVVEFWVRGIWNTGFYYGWGYGENNPKIETEDKKPVIINIGKYSFTLNKTIAYADETSDAFTFSSSKNIDIPFNWGLEIDCTLPSGKILKSESINKLSYIRDSIKLTTAYGGLITGSSFMWGYGENQTLFQNTVNSATEQNPVDLKFRIKIYEY